jgi:hypothetical protein
MKRIRHNLPEDKNTEIEHEFQYDELKGINFILNKIKLILLKKQIRWYFNL